MSLQNNRLRGGTFAARAVLLAGVAAFPALGMAQEVIELEPILVQGGGEGEARAPSATKTDTPLVDVPAAVSVVTAEEMARRGVRDLQQAVSYSASVTADEYGSDNRYDYFRIRGFFQTTLGTYRDGLPLRNLSFTTARMEPYGLERVEILKGSTSTLFGLNAPGGLVNAVTKRPQREAFGEVYTTLGEDHAEVGTDFGGPLDALGVWSWRLTAKVQEGSNGIPALNDDRVYVAPALTYAPTDRTTLTLLADYTRRDGNTGNSLPFGAPVDSQTFLGEPDFSGMNTREKNVGYAFAHEFGNGLTLRQNARYGTVDLTYEQVYPNAGDPAVSRSAYAVYGEVERFAVDTQLQYDHAFGRIGTRTLVGVDHVRDRSEEVIFFGAAGGIDIANPVYCGRACVVLPEVGFASDIEQVATGVYLQEEVTLDERWILTLGGRYDHVETTDAVGSVVDEAFTTRVGLTYRAGPDLSFYGNYSESFQPASRYQLAEAPRPQEGVQYEIGAKWQPDSDTLFTAALFDLTQTNLSSPVSATLRRQIGEVNVRGLELEGRFALTDRIGMNAAYAYWDARIVEDGASGNTGNRPQLVPEHIASLWGDYTVPVANGDLVLGLGARFTGPSYSSDANTYEIAGRTLVDAAVSYDLTARTQLALNVTNLFDHEHIATRSAFDDTAFYGDRREVRATLRHRW